MPKRIDLEARKAHLAEAVWAVILEEGIAAVSMRTVAQRAGVVVGSLRHVFPTRAELVAFSGQLMHQRVTERIKALPRSSELREDMIGIIACVMPLDSARRAEFEVNLALLAEAPASRQIIELRDEAHQHLNWLFRNIVTELANNANPLTPTTPASDIDPEASSTAGPEIAAKAARLHALVDGLAFHLIHQPPEADTDWALQLVRAEVNALCR